MRYKNLRHEPLEQRNLLATFVVSDGSDTYVQSPGDAPGTLRQAIFDANELPGSDVIEFAPDLDRVSVNGSVWIRDALEIRGASRDALTIELGQFSTFEVRAPITFRDMSFVSHAEVCHACDSSGNDIIAIDDAAGVLDNVALLGGVSNGIRVVGQSLLTLDSTLVTGFGFTGIDASGGDVSVVVRDSTIEGNVNRGISVAGDLLVERSTIADNTAVYSRQGGSGIRVSGTFVLRDSLVHGNVNGPRLRDVHGGIYVRGTATIENSTVSGNSSGVAGGGIWASGSLAIHGSTITENFTEDNMSIRTGGGVFMDSGDLSISNSIVAGNDPRRLREPSARDIGLGPGATLTVHHSLVGDASGTDLNESLAADADGNIVGGPSLGLVDPLLEPLAYNGGPTLTHSLLPESPAVDGGKPNESTDFDQRGTGFVREFGPTPDMGAFELQALVGDFDEDYQLGCTEVDQLALEIANGSALVDVYDLNDDGLVNASDMDVLLTNIAIHRLHSREPVLSADANLDGIVDVQDYERWRQNRFTVSPGICQGDFNRDGLVDGSDLNLWVQENQVDPPAMTASFVPIRQVTKRVLTAAVRRRGV